MDTLSFYQYITTKFTGMIKKVLVLLILISSACFSLMIYGQDDSSSETQKELMFYVFGGLKGNIPNGNGIYYPNPNAIDPAGPIPDSTKYKFNLSPHLGIDLSKRVFNSFYADIGVEWNSRKFVLFPYWDSTELGLDIPSYNEVRYYTHNLEIPIDISYVWKRIKFGAGARIKILEFKITREYMDNTEVLNYFDINSWRKFFYTKIFYPHISTEVLIFDSPKHPMWLNISYEFRNEYSSSIYLSYKIKL